MPELTKEQRELLDMFKYGAEYLETAVKGLSEKELEYSMGPGEWSIRQHVQHIADDGDVWSMIIKKAIATPGAKVRFEDFPGNDAWAEAIGYDKRPVKSAIALMKAHRKVLSELAELFPDRWDQTVIITDSDGKEVCKVSVKDMLAGNEGHVHDHIVIIEAIKNKHGMG